MISSGRLTLKLINSSIFFLLLGFVSAEQPDEAARAAFAACQRLADSATPANRANGRRFSQNAYGSDLCQMLLERNQDVDVAVGEFLETGGLPGVRPPYPDPYLVRIARQADLVVVGRLVSRSARLTPSRTFLFSEFRMEVEEVVKGEPAAAGGSITVLRPGGTLTLGKRRIRAVSSQFKPFQVGGRYVLFLSLVRETGSYLAAAEMSFQSLPAGGVAKLTASPDVNLARSRGDFEGFVNEVRDAVASIRKR